MDYESDIEFLQKAKYKRLSSAQKNTKAFRVKCNNKGKTNNLIVCTKKYNNLHNALLEPRNKSYTQKTLGNTKNIYKERPKTGSTDKSYNDWILLKDYLNKNYGTTNITRNTMNLTQSAKKKTNSSLERTATDINEPISNNKSQELTVMSKKRLMLEEVKDMLVVNVGGRAKEKIVEVKEEVKKEVKKEIKYKRVNEEITTANVLIEKYKDLYDKVEVNTRRTVKEKSGSASPFKKYLTEIRKRKFQQLRAPKAEEVVEELREDNKKAREKSYYIGPEMFPLSTYERSK